MQLIKTNGIVEGSLARLVKEQLGDGNGSVIIPQYLTEDVENWCSGTSGAAGELVKFLNAYLSLRNQAETDDEEGEGEGETEGKGEGYKLSLKTIMDGNLKELLLTTVSHLGEISDQFLASEIIYYTVSYYLENYTLLNNLTVVIPPSACDELHDDALERVIKREELKILFSKIGELAINDADREEETGNTLLKKLVFGKDLVQGEVLSASVVANMVGNENFATVLKLKTVTISETSLLTYFDVGQTSYLENRLNPFSANPWSKELPILLDALAVLFADQVNEENFEFNGTTMMAALLNLLGNSEAIKLCKSSRILYQAYPELLDRLDAMQGNQGDDDDNDDDDDHDENDGDDEQSEEIEE